jgi:DedD protein
MALLEGKSPELAASDGAKPPSGAKGNADAAADSKPESFVVQIGAFSDAAKAQSLKDKLAGGGLKPYTEVVQTTEGERTRLRVGPYSTREAADKAQERVRKLFAIDAKVVPL